MTYLLTLRYLAAEKNRSLLDVLVLSLALFMLAAIFIYDAAVEQSRRQETSLTVLVFAKASPLNQLPNAVGDTLAGFRGVKDVARAVRFGAMIDGGRIRLPSFAVDESYLTFDQDVEVSPAAMDRWRRCKTCVLVGAELMAAQGWRVGQSIRVQSDTWRQRSGELGWPLEIAGFYRNKGEGAGPAYATYLHYAYLNDGRTSQVDTTGMFRVTATDPPAAKRLPAAIDARTEASSTPTWSFTEDAANAQMADQLESIINLVKSTVFVLCLSIAVIVSNDFLWFAESRLADIRTMHLNGVRKRQLIAVFAGRNACLVVSALIAAALAGLALQAYLFGAVQAGAWLVALGWAAAAVAFLASFVPPAVVVLGKVGRTNHEAPL